MKNCVIDLSTLTPEERRQFAENPGVLSYSCPETCCLYMRYSSERQSEQSIEGQLRELVAYCLQHGYRVSAVYVDRAVSAHTGMNKRAAFQQMLADSKRADWNTVLVWKLDRFARNRQDSAAARAVLIKNGCMVVSATENITDSPEGRLLESVLEGLNEYYSEDLKQKIKRGNRESALKGQALGGSVPLGYKIEKKKWVLDPLTAPLVEEAFTRYAAGETATAICADFNARGHRTSKGSLFNKSSFKNIFRNEKYIGVYKYTDIRQEDAVPRIVTDDVWQAVQSRLRSNAAAPARGKAKVAYLLSGKVFCGKCGGPMIGDTGTGKTGGKYSYYTCAGRKQRHSCDKRSVPKGWLENMVARDALDALTDEVIDYVATAAARQSENEIRQNTNIPVYQQEIADIERKVRNLTKAIESSDTAPDALVARISELEARKKGLQAQLKEAQHGVVPLTKESIVYFLESVRSQAIPLETQKYMLIDLFVNSVTVYDDDPDHIIIKTAYNLTSIPAKTYKVPTSKLNLCSDLGLNGPPYNTKTNSITVVGMVFVCTRRHALP
nr:MAG TPA: integrase [Caudoviricetes sp.]